MTVAPLVWCTPVRWRMSEVDEMEGFDRRKCLVVVLVPPAGRCAVCLGGLGQGAEIQLDHPGVTGQRLSGPGVGVASLVEDVPAVADLQAAACVLLDHDDRYTGAVDGSGLDEHLVLQRRGQTR